MKRKQTIKDTSIKLTLLAMMLLGLPLLGIVLAGKPISIYLEFPPKTLYVEPAPFAWFAFIVYSLFSIAAVGPFLWQVFKKSGSECSERPLARFPWWGWFGVLLCISSWIFAWTRFPWFERLQPHTFTPLWISYIITLNATTYWRRGYSTMTDRPICFLLLFPASASFWWFFEYLNRFVQNWHYVGKEFSPPEYFFFATLSFSTVLPAFISTREWLLSLSWIEERFQGFPPLHVPRPKILAAFTLIAAGVGLLLLGILPHYLFAFLWISPLLILVSLQTLLKENHVFVPVAFGDWRIILSSALAALVCGFFWEMWNCYSLAKWVYHVPFVERFHLFEMPILGYAGYLPFGLECSVVAEMVLAEDRKKQAGLTTSPQTPWPGGPPA